MPSNFNLYDFLISMAALVVCITIHEFAHAVSAYRAGDDTPRAQGRLSLNPLDHLDPMGTLMMVVTSIYGFGFGWGKPVRVNPFNFNNPRWDNLRVSLWGPLSNIITALLVGTLLRLMLTSMYHNGTVEMSQFTLNLFDFLREIAVLSVFLAFFNLLPIGPLDGAHIMSSLLPADLARQYDRFMGQFGLLIFFAFIFAGKSVLPIIVGPPLHLLDMLITGGILP